MLIIGAKGFAKEVLEIFHQRNETENIYFFDSVSDDVPNILYNQFKVIKKIEDLKDLFESGNNNFVLGIGNPVTRYKLSQMFLSIGGVLNSIVSPFSQIGHYDTIIEKGTNIMTNVIITNDVKIGEGCLLNLDCTVGHDVVIGKYCELSPSVNISGNCKIGDFCNFGTGAIVLPKITIGDNVTVGAGAVVTQNIESNSVVVGIPAKIIKKLEPLIL